MQSARYAEDVKDVLHFCEKLSRRQAALTVNGFLQALLMIRRPFNRLDRLCHEAAVPVKELHKQIKATSTQNQTLDLHALLAQSEQIAAFEAKQSGLRQTVEVEHLLKGLYFVSEPATQTLLDRFHLTPDSIDQAMVSVKAKQGRNSILFLGRELTEVIGFVLVFLILIKSLFGELRLIPSESMVPGLQINDRLVIERVSRWYRPYQRGDILVFYPPMSQLKNDPISLFLRWTGFSGLIYKKDDYIDVAYIKRLIGLPGDTVDVRPGEGVYVNGKKLDEPYVNEVADTCTLMKPEPYCGSIQIPAGSYYLMGDNRNQSLDSRYWGFAKQERVIGRAVFRIWPLNRFGTIPPAPYDQK